MIYIQIKNNKGFTLVETLFYIAGLVLLLLTISTIFIYSYKWYSIMTIEPRVNSSGIIAVDRITKEIHDYEDVDTINSVLNNDNGVLVITNTVNTNTFTKRFYIQNGCIYFLQESGVGGCITPNGMTVSKLRFARLTNSLSSAVTFDIDISYKTQQGTTTKTFGSFAILKQSYE